MLASTLTALLALPLVTFALPSSTSPHNNFLQRRSSDNSSEPTSYVWARAHVQSTPASGLNISAKFEFEGYFDGTPTFVRVKVLSGLYKDFTNNGTQPAVSAFNYHIHTNPLNGSFASALAHLDTLNLTEGYICNPAFPALICQNGDLSGKHGALNGTTNGKIPAFGYSDDFVRFWPNDFSILGRSIIIHGFNKTRLAGGNIISTLDGTADENWNPTGKPSTYNPPSSLPKVAPVQPTPVIIASNGTIEPTRAYLDSLPYPVPFPLLRISETLNVTRGTANNSRGIQVYTNLPSSEGPPFNGTEVEAGGWSF